MGYLNKKYVQETYVEYGIDMVHEISFYNAYKITPSQFEHDIEFFYGFLTSATKKIKSAHILKHIESQDGLLAWIGMLKQYDHHGSAKLRSEELKIKIEKHTTIQNSLVLQITLATSNLGCMKSILWVISSMLTRK